MKSEHKYVDKQKNSLLRKFFGQRWSALAIEALIVIVAVFVAGSFLFAPGPDLPDYDPVIANLQATIDAQERELANQELPIDVEALKEEAWRNLRLRNFQGAIAQYEIVLDIVPNDAESYNGLSIAYRELREYDRAVGYATRAIEISPDYAFAYNNRAIAYAYLFEYDQAHWDLDRAVRLDSENATFRNNRCWIYGELGRYERALNDCNRAIELNPDGQDVLITFENRCWLNVEMSFFENALQDCNRVLEAVPRCFAEVCGLAFWNRGRVFEAYGETQLAFANYERAIAIGSRYANMYLHIGNAYHAQGLHAEGTSLHNVYKVLAGRNAINLEDRPIVEFEVLSVNVTPEEYATRGMEQYNQGEFDMALLNFTRAINIAPTNEYLSYRAATFLELGYYDGAIMDYYAILRSDPNNADAYAMLGAAFDFKSYYGEALAAYQRHVELAGDDAYDFAVDSLEQLEAMVEITTND